MNGPTVIILLVLAVVPLFLAVVWLDRWLDDRETNALITQERRRQEARERLAAMYRENPAHIRLGHRDGGAE
jgi:hypothetical protein